MDSEVIIKILEHSHDPLKWAFFKELRIGTGYGKDAEQRLDAWAINYSPAKKNVTRTYEVKVSLSDFRSEIKKPFKRRPGLRLANEFYFVVPTGLVPKTDIPPECGLIEVTENGKLNPIIAAPFRDVLPPTWRFLSSVMRKLDIDRKHYLQALAGFQEKVREIDEFSETTLGMHIDKWRKYNYGSREIPDRILQALENVMWDLKTSMEDAGFYSEKLD
jgi:hypothetical protein